MKSCSDQFLAFLWMSFSEELFSAKSKAFDSIFYFADTFSQKLKLVSRFW